MRWLMCRLRDASATAGLALALVALGATSCLAHPRRELPPQPSIYGPPDLVGTPRLHRHGRCEHPSRWHQGRRVWWYLGGWEFMDAGKLYRYPARKKA